jgi:hypothetical protein
MKLRHWILYGFAGSAVLAVGSFVAGMVVVHVG